MKTKRILSVILAFAMIISTMCFPVFATEVADAEALATALAEDGEVVLTSDIQLTEMLTIPENTTVTLDLNGHAITVPEADPNTGKHIYALDNFGTLTIKDSLGTGSINARGIYNGYNSGSQDKPNAVMTIEGGTINAIDVNGGFGVGNYAILTINGGTFTAKEDDPAVADDTDATPVCSYGTATLNGGSITSTTNSTYAVITYGELIVPEASTVEVTGSHGAVAVEGGTAEINAGTYVCDGVAGQTDNIIYLSSGAESIKINGGTFTHNGKANDAESGAAVVASGSTAAVEINGGTFVGLNGSVSGNTNTTITGGSFSNTLKNDEWDKITSYVAPGAAVEINGEAFVGTAETKIEFNGTDYDTLQAAIDAATETAGDHTINIDGVIDEGTAAAPIIIHQTEGVNITIKGNGSTTVFKGYIAVYGHARSNGAETLTFDSITFETTENAHVFIEQTEKTGIAGSSELKCYPHNITVTGCVFKGTGDAENTAVGMKFRYGYNIKVEKTSSIGLHSLMQNYAGVGLTVDTVNISGKNGIALGTSQGVKVTKAVMEVAGYGLRADAQIVTETTITDCNITAFIPVVVRKTETDYALTFDGENTMTATNNDGLWLAVGSDEYETNGVLPEAGTGTVEVTLNDNGLSTKGVHGAEVAAKSYVAYIGETGYETLADAFTAAKDMTATPVEIKMTADAKDISAIGVRNTVVLDLNGYTVSFAASANIGFQLKEKSEFTIKDTSDNKTGEVIVNHATGGRVIDMPNGSAKFTLESGKLTSSEVGIFTADSTAAVEIKGGSVECNEANTDSYALQMTAGEAKITNGSFKAYNAVEVTRDASLEITGGTFSNDVKDYCANGFTCEANPDGTYGVVVAPAAYIGETPYETLAAAFEAVKDGETITLNIDADVTDVTVEAGKSIKLDLNGNTMTMTPAGWGGVYAITVNGEMTINGDGEVVLKPQMLVGYGIRVEEGGKLTVKGGDFSISGISGVAASVDGELVVNGGSFAGPTNTSLFNTGDNAKVTITDGEFSHAPVEKRDDDKREISISGGTYGNGATIPEEWIAKGYQFNAETGEVEKRPAAQVSNYDELKAAIAAAEPGDTVQLTAYIDCGANGISIEKEIILDLGGYTLTTKGRNFSLALKNEGIVVKNGKLNHAGTVAAIKVWNAKEISDLEIDVTGTSASGNTIDGIVIQENAAGVDLIKNVRIHSTGGQGVASGIKTYNCGNTTEYVIGALENVTIDATDVGMNISAPVGTATNCDIKGGVSGIELWIKGSYNAELTLVDCEVSGNTQAVYTHDEFKNGVTNVGTLKLGVDEETTFDGGESGALLTQLNMHESKLEVAEEVTAAAVAVVNGERYFDTFAKAVKAAEAEAIITLVEDVTSAELLSMDKKLTIDLGSKTLSLGQAAAAFALRAAAATGGVAITDDVTFKNGTIDLTGATGLFEISGENGKLTMEDVKLIGTDVIAKDIISTTHSDNGAEKIVLNKVVVDIDGHTSGDGVYFAKGIGNTSDGKVYPTIIITDSNVKISDANGLLNGLNLAITNSTFDIDGAQNHILRKVSGSLTDTIVKGQVANNGESFIKNTNGEALTFAGSTQLVDEAKAGAILESGSKFENVSGFMFSKTVGIQEADLAEGYRIEETTEYDYVVPAFKVSAVADKETAVAGDEITVNVVVTGGDFTNAGWGLKFDSTKVKYTGTVKDGQTVEETAKNYVLSGKVLGSGSDNEFTMDNNGECVVATYTFEALNLDNEANAVFEIVDVTKGTGSSDYKVYVDNYDMAAWLNNVPAEKASDTVKIGMKTDELGSITNVPLTYNGMEQSGNGVSGAPTGATITYAKTKAVLEANKGTKLVPTFKPAGTHTYYARIDADGYDTYYLTGTLEIKQLEIIPTGKWNVAPEVNKVEFIPVLSGVLDGTYTGTVVVKNGETTIKELTAADFTYNGNGQAVYNGAPIQITGTTSGKLELTVEYTAGVADNYATSTGSAETDVSKSTAPGDDVTKLENAITNEFTYDGKDHSVEIGALPDGWSVKEQPTDTVKNVGEDKVVKVVFENEQYNDVEIFVKLSVTPKAVTLRAVSTTKGIGEPDNLTVEVTPALVNEGDLGNVEAVRKAGQTGETAATYDITVNYTPNKNYDVTVIDGTLTIGAPEFKVEVVDNRYNDNKDLADVKADYANGSRLILVHTDADYAFFTYNGKHMYDVTDAGYEYFDHDYTNNAHQAGKKYRHVYAIVVEAEFGSEATEACEQQYADGVEFAGSDATAAYAPVKVTYDANVNEAVNGDKLDENDFSTTNGVYNALYDLDLKQISILKADFNKNKIVNTADSTAVKTEVVK